MWLVLRLDKRGFIMGAGLVCEEYSKAEHVIVFLVLAGITIQVFAKYALISVDLTSFAIFAAMCFAGYFALKSAQEIVLAIEERKKSSLYALKADMLIINPAIFSKSSKYTTSTYSKNLTMAS